MCQLYQGCVHSFSPQEKSPTVLAHQYHPSPQTKKNKNHMKMKPIHKLSSVALLIGSVITAQSAIIGISDYSLTPDGSTTTGTQDTDIETPNGGSRVLDTGVTKTVYLVTIFNFGASSDAHITGQFYANVPPSAGRLGIEVQDSGLVRIIGTSPLPSFDLATDLAGQTVTLLAKLNYDPTNDVTYSQSNTSNDTIMNVWVNPTTSSLEGSGLAAGDLSTVWNSAAFRHFRQAIANQSTPGTSGDSSITDTVILTGADATWANALSAATVPEPSTTALLGLGGLALILRRRK
jgi:hypothetical protein